MTWEPTGLANSQSKLDVDMMTFFHTRTGIDSHTQQNSVDPESYEHEETGYSDASSIGRLPTFSFSLNSLTPLGAMRSAIAGAKTKGSRLVNVLVAVMEVEGTDTIRIKKGKDAGREVTVLKILGADEEGEVARATAWREVAELWGGVHTGVEGVKKGDVVLMESRCFPDRLITTSTDVAIP
jgi:hypothetical protein